MLRYNKFISLILALSIIISTVPSVFAQELPDDSDETVFHAPREAAEEEQRQKEYADKLEELQRQHDESVLTNEEADHIHSDSCSHSIDGNTTGFLQLAENKTVLLADQPASQPYSGCTPSQPASTNDFKFCGTNDPHYIKNEHENVSMYWGTMSYFYNIVNMPGKNGLDLSINLVNEMSLAYAWSSDSTNLDRTIAHGWMVDMPYVSRKDLEHDNSANGGGAACYLFKLYDGKSYLATYGSNNNYKIVDDHYVNYSLVEVPVTDVAIKGVTLDSGVPGFEVTCQDGRREYYTWGGDQYSKNRGNLTKVIDRFGNTITYTYKTVLSTKADLIEKITDSAGKEIKFTYTVNNNKITNVNVDVTVPSYTKRYATLNINNNFLDSIIDAEEKETKFYYGNYTKKIYDEYLNVVTSVTPVAWHYLDKVEYPSGRITKYNYEYYYSRYRYDHVLYYDDGPWAHFDYGYTDTYKIHAITELYKNESGNEVIKNKTWYDFGYDEFPIHGGGKSISSTVYNDGGLGYNEYKTKTHYEFERSDKLIRETTYSQNNLVTEIVSNSYNDQRQVEEKTVSLKKDTNEKIVYKEGFKYLPGKTLITEYTDKFGNIIEYGYGTNQAVDSPYGIPLTITKNFYDNGSLASKQLTTNVLSSGKEKIASTIENFDTDNDGEYDKTMESKYIYYASMPNVPDRKDIYEDSVEIYSESYAYRYDQALSALTRRYLSNNDNFELAQKATTTEFSYNLVTGWLIGESNEYPYNIYGEGKLLTTYERDEYGRITEIIYPYGRKIVNVYSFDASTNLNKVVIKDTDTSSGNCYETFAYYDGYGRVHREGEYHSGTEVITGEYEYSYNDLYKKHNTNGGTEVYLYDDYKNIKEIIYQENSSNVYGSDEYNYDYYNNTVTSKEGEFETKVYNDKYGRPEKLTKPINPSQTYMETTGYDYFGNVNLHKDGKNNETKYVYNQLGHMISSENALGEVTTYQHDIYGNITSMETPGGSVYTNTYDVMGTLLSSTDPVGETEKFYYDSSGRIVKTKDKNGQISETTYKSGTNLPETITTINTCVGYSYNGYGNMTSMTDSEGVTSYSYYPNKRLEKITVPDGKYIEYGYNLQGQVTSMRDFNGTTTTYEYDGMNRLEYQDDNQNLYLDAMRVPDSIYYDNNLRVQKTYYSGGFLRQSALFDFDAFEWVSISAYKYDLAGNPVQKREVLTGKSNITVDYQYDALNRLAKELQTNADNGAVTYTSEYTFDKNNNILTQSSTHSGDGYAFDFKQNGSDYSINNINMHNTLYNYDANNRLLNKREIVNGTGSYTGQVEKATNFTYDKNGNTIKKDIGGQVDRNVVEYAYDNFNQLKEVKSDGITVGAYTYSGNGLRRSKTANGTITKYYWNGQNMINEAVDGTITATNKYDSYGLYHRSGVGDIVKNDHGDVIGVMSQGTITHQYQYDAYGNQKTSNANDTNPFRYCGEYYDDESGLIYLRNRYYDPDLGRFINEDPITSGANWYIYCAGNPVRFTDSTGLDPALDEYIKEHYNGQVTVTFTVLRPVPNSREAVDMNLKSGKVGHTFLRVDYGDGNVAYVGYYAAKGEPSEKEIVSKKDMAGVVWDDSGRDWNIAKTYVITREQADTILQYYQDHGSDKYNIVSNNCTTFAVNALAAANLSAPTIEHQWTIPADVQQKLRDDWRVTNADKVMSDAYGYSPADAAQDMKKYSGWYVVNYNGVRTRHHYDSSRIMP